MTDRARELVERLRGSFDYDPGDMQDALHEAADFIEQSLTPPEGDMTQWDNIKTMLLTRVHEFPWDNAGGPDTFKLVNPDGPEVVAFIEEMLNRKEAA